MTGNSEFKESRSGDRKRVVVHHGATITDRKRIEVYGVKDVMSFDDNGMVLKTELGDLEIEGTEMHVNVLDLEKGRVLIEGNIDALIYSDSGDRKSADGKRFFGRLFK